MNGTILVYTNAHEPHDGVTAAIVAKLAVLCVPGAQGCVSGDRLIGVLAHAAARFAPREAQEAIYVIAHAVKVRGGSDEAFYFLELEDVALVLDAVAALRARFPMTSPREDVLLTVGTYLVQLATPNAKDAIEDPYGARDIAETLALLVPDEDPRSAEIRTLVDRILANTRTHQRYLGLYGLGRTAGGPADVACDAARAILKLLTERDAKELPG